MKATELMVGEWVQNPLGYKAQVLDIHYIKDEGDGYGGGYRIHIGKSNLGVVQWLEEKDIEPIPLTPEILEENGFWFGYTTNEEDFCSATGAGYPEKGWCWDDGAGTIKIIFPTETDGGLVLLDDGNFDRDINFGFVETLYIHELQHALRLCGIKKEIIL